MMRNTKILTAAAIAMMGLSAPAFAQSTEAPVETQVPPANVDTNADGVADAWDTNGDKAADAWDLNGDGTPDAYDADGDGKPDAAPVAETTEPGAAPQ